MVSSLSIFLSLHYITVSVCLLTSSPTTWFPYFSGNRDSKIWMIVGWIKALKHVQLLVWVIEPSGKEKSILPCCRGSCWLGEKNPYSNKHSEKLLLCYLHKNEASDLFLLLY